MDHADFRANFDCRLYHGDVCMTERGPGRPFVVTGYEPDERCPDLIVWAIACGHWLPGFRKGWNRESVMAHLGIRAA
jgi:hypothetical protein